MHKLIVFFLILAVAVAANSVVKETAGLGPEALSTNAKDQLPGKSLETVSNDGDENDLKGAEFFHSGYRPSVVRTYGYGAGYGYGGWGYGDGWYPRRNYW